jgi:hypothetical protein
MKTSNQKTQKQAVKTTRARRPRKLAGKRIIAKAGEQKGYLTVRQVAAKLDVTLATVQVWIRNGEFPGAERLRREARGLVAPHGPARGEPRRLPVSRVVPLEAGRVLHPAVPGAQLRDDTLEAR